MVEGASRCPLFGAGRSCRRLRSDGVQPLPERWGRECAGRCKVVESRADRGRHCAHLQACAVLQGVGRQDFGRVQTVQKCGAHGGGAQATGIVLPEQGSVHQGGPAHRGVGVSVARRVCEDDEGTAQSGAAESRRGFVQSDSEGSETGGMEHGSQSFLIALFIEINYIAATRIVCNFRPRTARHRITGPGPSGHVENGRGGGRQGAASVCEEKLQDRPENDGSARQCHVLDVSRL